jgi:REP element-mobilizing transposase RayT
VSNDAQKSAPETSERRTLRSIILPPVPPKRSHLQRLTNVWSENPLYFLTCCTAARRPLLAREDSARVLVAAFSSAQRFHRWAIGKYVVMPDHVHFFARPEHEAKSLSDFVRDWKKWTSRELTKTGAAQPVWQNEFFDHVLRSSESYSEKWEYVRQNPVRAGLVAEPERWPYAGEVEVLSFES